MEKAILNLEREFQRVVGELEFHAHRLEKDWGNDFRGAHNPIKLFKRIKGLERQLPQLQKLYVANLHAKQEAVACLPQMLSNMQSLASLKEAIGFRPPATEAEVEGEEETSFEQDCQAAEDLVQAWKDEIAAVRATSSVDVNASSTQIPAEAAFGAGAEGDTAAAVLQDSNTANVTAPALAIKRLTGAAKMQDWEVVDEDEFRRLPASVRGRCKLKAVNNVYALIRTHFLPFLANNIKAAAAASGSAEGGGGGRRKKRLKKAAPLTIPMLNKQGGKVTGYTGECILNSLRQLDLVDVDFKSGRVSVAKMN